MNYFLNPLSAKKKLGKLKFRKGLVLLLFLMHYSIWWKWRVSEFGCIRMLTFHELISQAQSQSRTQMKSMMRALNKIWANAEEEYDNPKHVLIDPSLQPYWMTTTCWRICNVSTPEFVGSQYMVNFPQIERQNQILLEAVYPLALAVHQVVWWVNCNSMYLWMRTAY